MNVGVDGGGTEKGVERMKLSLVKGGGSLQVCRRPLSESFGGFRWETCLGLSRVVDAHNASENVSGTVVRAQRVGF